MAASSGLSFARLMGSVSVSQYTPTTVGLLCRSCSALSPGGAAGRQGARLLCPRTRSRMGSNAASWSWGRATGPWPHLPPDGSERQFRNGLPGVHVIRVRLIVGLVPQAAGLVVDDTSGKDRSVGPAMVAVGVALVAVEAPMTGGSAVLNRRRAIVSAQRMCDCRLAPISKCMCPSRRSAISVAAVWCGYGPSVVELPVQRFAAAYHRLPFQGSGLELAHLARSRWMTPDIAPLASPPAITP